MNLRIKDSLNVENIRELLQKVLERAKKNGFYKPEKMDISISLKKINGDMLLNFAKQKERLNKMIDATECLKQKNKVKNISTNRMRR